MLQSIICLCLVTQLCPTLCHPMDCSWPGSSVHRDSPGKNTGVGCCALLQGIFPIQGSNPGLPHCRQILSHQSHQESLRNVPKLKKHRTQCLKKCHQDVACLSSIGSAFLCIWLHSQIGSHLDSATWVSSSLKLIFY